MTAETAHSGGAGAALAVLALLALIVFGGMAALQMEGALEEAPAVSAAVSEQAQPEPTARALTWRDLTAYAIVNKEATLIEAPRTFSIAIEPPSDINDHAANGHTEATLSAEQIWARYRGGDYTCVRAYFTLKDGPHVLWLFSYSDHAHLMGGMVTLPDGRMITSYATTRKKWCKVIARDGYSGPWIKAGKCDMAECMAG